MIGIGISVYQKSRMEGVFKIKEKLKTLSSTLDKIKKEYYALCSNNIKSMFEDFFTTGEDRISIYRHEGNHFILLGRYSQSPQFNKRSTKPYSDDEGLIGRGWNEGEVFENNIRPWKGSGRDYNSDIKRICTISDDRLRSISMKSTAFYIRTLSDDDTAEDPDGIIVFESKNKNAVDKGKIQKMLSEKETSLLKFLQGMKSVSRETSQS